MYVVVHKFTRAKQQGRCKTGDNLGCGAGGSEAACLVEPPSAVSAALGAGTRDRGLGAEREGEEVLCRAEHAGDDVQDGDRSHQTDPVRECQKQKATRVVLLSEKSTASSTRTT